MQFGRLENTDVEKFRGGSVDHKVRKPVDMRGKLKKAFAGPLFHGRFADQSRFLKAWIDNPSITGAISPSGRFLARAMAACVDPSTPGPVVELGPGTGPVTAALIARGIAEDRLVLVEYDEGFCNLLALRYPKARIIRGDAYHLDTTLAGHLAAPAIAVVSSLPLLLRSEPDRLRVLTDAIKLMRASAPFIQFSYGLSSPLPRVGTMGDLAFSSHRLPPVLRNIPPAMVWVYRGQTR